MSKKKLDKTYFCTIIYSMLWSKLINNIDPQRAGQSYLDRNILSGLEDLF